MTKHDFEHTVVSALCGLVGIQPSRVKNTTAMDHPADQLMVEKAIERIVSEIVGEMDISYALFPLQVERGGDFTIPYGYGTPSRPEFGSICRCVEHALGDLEVTVGPNLLGMLDVVWPDGTRAAQLNISLAPRDILLTFLYQDCEGLED